MTETSLKYYLKIGGWAAIIATAVLFLLKVIQQSQRMSDMGINEELRVQTYALYTFGFGIEIPISLTAACLCLMASRLLTNRQQTTQSVFE